MDITVLIIIFVITFLVRVITVTVGGGGLILLPMLIFFGLPPSTAIASNRFGATSTFLSIIKFHQHGQVKWKLGALLLLPVIIGAVLGSFVVVNIDQDLFKKIIGAVILISIPFLLFKKEIGLKEKILTKKKTIIGMFMALPLSFLGGMVASTGMWFNYLYLYLGLTMLQTAATRKITGPAVAISSLVVLISAGLVHWPAAITMFVASALGAWVGAGLGVRAGNIWIKRLFILATLLGALKLLF
jgi:uncharacterized protein